MKNLEVSAGSRFAGLGRLQIPEPLATFAFYDCLPFLNFLKNSTKVDGRTLPFKTS
jgi:hypothetical protein